MSQTLCLTMFSGFSWIHDISFVLSLCYFPGFWNDAWCSFAHIFVVLESEWVHKVAHGHPESNFPRMTWFSQRVFSRGVFIPIFNESQSRNETVYLISSCSLFITEFNQVFSSFSLVPYSFHHITAPSFYYYLLKS